MRLARKLHMRCYRLHLRLVALCQATSLEPPYSVPVDPSSPPSSTVSYRFLRSDRKSLLFFPLTVGGGGGESCTRVLGTFIVDCQQLIYYISYL